MKGKRKIINIILLICLILLNAENVNAEDSSYKGTVTTAINDADTGIRYNKQVCVGEGNKRQCTYPNIYHDNYFNLTISGRTGSETAYCIDPGWAAGTFDVNCDYIASYRPPKAMKYVINSGRSHLVTQLALRFITINEGLFQELNPDTGAYIHNEWFTPGLGLIDSNNYAVNEARNLATTALQAARNDSGGRYDSKTEIILTQIKDNSIEENSVYEVTFKVETSQRRKVDLNINSFKCENCSIKSFNFDGYEGELKVEVRNKKCNYTIKVNYISDDGDVYICRPSDGSRRQQIVSLIKPDSFSPSDNGGSSDGYKQKWDFSVRNSSGYYKKWCTTQPDDDDGDTPPDDSPCENDGTKFSNDTMCDKSDDNKVTVSGPENVMQCLLKKRDENGNTYQMFAAGNISKNNPYCSVYCKEDYEMNLPGAQYANSGRYFNLKPTVIKGTRTCYATGAANNNVEGIDVDRFKEEVKDAQRAVVDAYNSYKEEWTRQKQAVTNRSYDQGNITSCSDIDGSCTIEYRHVTISPYDVGTGDLEELKKNLDKAQTRLTNILDNMSECYSWENNFCFHPKATFDYKEDYNRDINYRMKSLETTMDSVSGSGELINEKYDLKNPTNTIQKDISYIECGEDGCNSSTRKINPSIRYIKSEVKKEAEFNNTATFATNIPHGTVTKKDLAEGNYLYDYEYLGAVFPIALERTTGLYNWSLEFTNIGQKNNNESYNMEKCDDPNTSDVPELGRLNKVAESTKNNNGIGANIGYVCLYVVDIDDCPDCDFECSCDDVALPPGYRCKKESKNVCKIIVPDEEEPPKKCDDCEIYCINCIFNGKDTYSYRTISLSNVNPNTRTMGANWTSDKGETTKKEIEDINNGAENVYQKATYSFTINPTQMQKIRDYNNNVKSSYADSDMTYRDYGKYSSAVGYSGFLRDHEGKYFDSNRNDDWDKWEFWTTDVNTEGNGPAWK